MKTKRKARAPQMGDQRTWKPANTLREGGFRKVWGNPAPRYTGWYCALNRHLADIQKVRETEGAAPRPFTDMKEIVYVHEDGSVHSVCFRYDWKKGEKYRGRTVSKPVLSRTWVKDWCGWEHLLTGSGRVRGT